MDRMVVYPGAIPLDSDLLRAQQNAMSAFGFLAQATIGTSTMVDGLQCVPTNPASMAVTVTAGSIISQQPFEASQYGSLPADTSDSLVKMGLNISPQNFTLTAPTGAGQSINYLIQVTFQESDANPVVLPYYNSANPSQPYSGPNNTGTPQNTVRQQRAALQLKAGAPAPAGSQATPSVDIGYVGLWIITVSNGQVAVQSSSIAMYPGAPFINFKVGQFPPPVSGVDIVTAQSYTYTTNDFGRMKVRSYTSGAMTDTLPSSATNLWSVVIQNAGSSAQPLVIQSPTFVTLDGAAGGSVYLGPGQSVRIASNGAGYYTIARPPRMKVGANINLYVSTSGSETNNGLLSTAAFATIQKAWNFLVSSVDLNGFAVTINVANGTYTGGLVANANPAGATGSFSGAEFPAVSLVGNPSSPSSVVISNPSGNAIVVEGGAALSVSGVRVTSGASGQYTGNGILAGNFGYVTLVGSVDFGSCGWAHMQAASSGIISGGVGLSGYTVSASAAYHWYSTLSSQIAFFGVSVSIGGSPLFTYFAACSTCSTISCAGMTFSGPASGSRYDITTNGVIYTAGQSATYLPGTGAGVTTTGGQYA